MEEQEKAEKEFQLKWLDIMMAEYNTLRTECADSMKLQKTILHYGLTANGVLIGFGANLWNTASIAQIIFVVFIPFICNLIMLIWSGEIRRVSRAGQYLKRLEGNIEKIFSEKNIKQRPLNWHTFLRSPKEMPNNPNKKSVHIFIKSVDWVRGLFTYIFSKKNEKNNKYKSNYIAIIVMFLGLSLMSIALGYAHNFSMYKIENSLDGFPITSWFQDNKWFLICYFIVLIINVIFFCFHFRFLQREKK